MKGGLCLLSDIFSSSDILAVTVSDHRLELHKGKGGKLEWGFGNGMGFGAGEGGGVKVGSTQWPQSG